MDSPYKSSRNERAFIETTHSYSMTEGKVVITNGRGYMLSLGTSKSEGNTIDIRASVPYTNRYSSNVYNFTIIVNGEGCFSMKTCAKIPFSPHKFSFSYPHLSFAFIRFIFRMLRVIDHLSPISHFWPRSLTTARCVLIVGVRDDLSW